MTRSILSGVFAVVGICVIGLVPSACQSGGVGDPCVPEPEYDPGFAGFKVSEENIESRSFQCDTRICLANYFQGRVSCPLGQAERALCAGGPDDDSACGDGEKCRASAFEAPACEDNAACNAFSGGENGKCNAEGKFCECGGDERPCPAGFACDDKTKQCTKYVCAKEGIENCQVPKDDPGAGENEGKGCCVPGTDTPIAASVCGQCAEENSRDAPNAVYCSCRCGVAEGEEEDPNFNFCECPDGFECAEIRKNVGLGDVQITGKYCIKAGTETDAVSAPTDCGKLASGSYHNGQQCSGAP
jgi:hypothetical protein